MVITLLFGLGTSIACALDPVPKKASNEFVENVSKEGSPDFQSAPEHRAKSATP